MRGNDVATLGGGEGGTCSDALGSRLVRGARSVAAAAVVLSCSCGAEGMGEGSRGCLAGAGKRKRPERMGWQVSGWMREGSTSGRQARAAVGVCVCGACLVCACACARACAWGGGGALLFFKTGRSRCLAICEAPARARVEGGKSLPRLSHSAPSSAWRPYC